jgi:hypothetical protein
MINMSVLIHKCHFDAIAWVSPATARKTRSHDDRYYPMVALILWKA